MNVTLVFMVTNCDVRDEELTLSIMNIGNTDQENVNPICDVNPCQNTGKCNSDRNVDIGYVCHCSNWARLQRKGR